MMTADTIQHIAKSAARSSMRAGTVPCVLSAYDIEAIKTDTKYIKHLIPTLGDRCPKGWKRIRPPAGHGVYEGDNHGFGAYMVDSSGFGSEYEAALTIEQFLNVLQPGFGYAVIEFGQFQVKIGMFARREPKP
jgi:hypothetical protein